MTSQARPNNLSVAFEVPTELEAADRYQQVLIPQPNRLVTLARVADCHYALGRLNEALTKYDELAAGHNNRGDVPPLNAALGGGDSQGPAQGSSSV